MNFMKERTVTMNRECILEQAKQHDSFYLYEDGKYAAMWNAEQKISA